MIRYLNIAGMLLLSQIAAAQITLTALNKNTIPKAIKYTGHIINAVKFMDSDGEHFVVTTETGLTKSKGQDMEGSSDAALYAYHYKKAGAALKLTWQTYDFIKDCSLDLTAGYLPKTFAVTDLDKNGKAEVWLMYETACNGDVSPSDMKIIMHEGDKKYAVRGTSKVKISATQYEGGKYTFDNIFKMGPEVFRQYATALWKKNL